MVSRWGTVQAIGGQRGEQGSDEKACRAGAKWIRRVRSVASSVDQTVEPTKISRCGSSLVLLVFTGTLLRLHQLTYPLTGAHAFRQTQTAYVALEYARTGINLLQTPLPIFGPNASVPMEFPLVQAAAALLIRCGASPDMAIRTLGLIGFQSTAVLLIIIVRRWHGDLAAIIAAIMFEFSPYGLVWGAAGLIDFPSVALALGMVLGLDSWFHRGSYRGLALGAISAWLAFLVKVTTAPSWSLLLVTSALVAFKLARPLLRIVIGFMAGPVVGVVLTLAWTKYADRVKNSNPLTEFLSSTDEVMVKWNFGTTHQRLDWHSYAVILNRIGSEIAGLAILVFLVAAAGIFLAPNSIQKILRSGWSLVAISAPLVFFNLYVVHDYYLIGIFPAIIALVGLGIEALCRRLPERFVLAASVFISSVILLNPSSWTYLRPWRESSPPASSVLALKDATHPNDLIITVSCDWDPEFLYYAERKGLMIANRNFSDRVWKFHHIGDYRYALRCNRNREIEKYLPPGYTTTPTSTPGLYLIVPPR